MDPSTSVEPPQAGEAPPRADKHARARGEPLGYRFAGVPDAFYDAMEFQRPKPPRVRPADWRPPPGSLGSPDEAWKQERRRIMRDRLQDIDGTVLGRIVKFPSPNRQFRFANVSAIARRLHKTTRTVQDSIRRLCLHELIERVPVPIPDPDHPTNKTGWRTVLLFVEGAQKTGKGPDRRPPRERKKPRADGQEGMKPVSSQTCLSDNGIQGGGMKPDVAQPMRPVSSKYCARVPIADGSELDEETPSSSLHAGTDDEDSRSTGSGESERPPWAEAAEEFGRLFGDGAGAKLRRNAGYIGGRIDQRWPLFLLALYLVYSKTKGPKATVIPDPLAYTVAAVRNGFLEEDAEDARGRYGPRPAAPEPAAGPPPPKQEPNPPPTAEEIHEAISTATTAPQVMRGVAFRILNDWIDQGHVRPGDLDPKLLAEANERKAKLQTKREGPPS